MDMSMPVLDGYTAVQQLRAKGFDSPVLALTASPAPQDKARALEVGCNSYLLKPIAMDELLSKVSEYLCVEAKNG
jgi:CheY-like chemotaxis protein